MKFWSKRWINDITKYTEEEKYSLATREAIKHFAALMQIASHICIYTSSPNFTQIANYSEMRSAKAAHYMLSSHTYLITFQTKQADEFALLNEEKIDPDLPNKLSSIAVTPLAHFFKITAQEVADIRIIRTNRSFRKSIVKGGIGAIGVYWGVNSALNISRWTIHPPYTNQRAELKAILCALEQAHEQGFKKLIVYSDSTYALGLFNSFINRNVKCSNTSNSSFLKRSAPLPPVNQDLVDKAKDFLKEMKVYFQHVKKDLNIIADRLSKQPFLTLFQERP